MFVYLITNKINGKRYVGQHVGDDLQKYWLDRHVYFALNEYQENRLLYRAIRKYGSENFDMIALVQVNSKWELDLYEVGMIKAWDLCNPEKGYNLTQGGGGSFGFRPGEETRLKMSKARIGKTMSEENRLKLIEVNKGNKYSLGKKMTEDNFNKLMAVHIGAKRTEEAKKKMSDAHKGTKWSPLQRLARHNRFHVSKGVINPKCSLCQERHNDGNSVQHTEIGSC